MSTTPNTEIAHFTLQDRLAVLSLVSKLELGQDKPTVAAAIDEIMDPFFEEETNRKYHLYKLIVKDALGYKWPQVLRAHADDLINLSIQAAEIIRGQVKEAGDVPEEPKPAKTPVKKKDEGEKKAPTPEVAEDGVSSEEEEKPKKTPRQVKRGRKKKEEEAPAKTEAPQPEKAPVKKMEEPPFESGNPAYELGPWDSLLVRLEALEAKMDKLVNRYDQLIDLMKDSHNDLGSHITQEMDGVKEMLRKLYGEQYKMLLDEDYVPSKSLD